MRKKRIKLQIMMLTVAIFAGLSFFPKQEVKIVKSYHSQNFAPSKEENMRRAILRINLLVSKGEVLIKENNLDGSYQKK